MNVVISVILICLISGLSLPAISQMQAKSLPFTQEQNLDGSKFVWFVYSKAGFNYEYIPTADLPLSPHFKPVEKPQSGDIAYWSKYMAVVNIQQGKLVSILVAGNEYDFEKLSKLYGNPTYYRYFKSEKRP